jgi:hypothetical protein
MVYLPYFFLSLMTLTPALRLRDAYRKCCDQSAERGEKQVSVSQHAESPPGYLAGRLGECDRRGREHPGRAEGARTPKRGAQRGGDSYRDEGERDQRRRH